ncbi:MAG: DUF2163 domain-containing protein [Methylococcales bacterium]|nr:DUF2163 domain-containing protein [Methylococcales bacterium]
MKSLSSGMMAQLAGYEFIIAELFTITLANGTVLRLTSGDGDIRIGAPVPAPVTLSANRPWLATQSSTTVFVRGSMAVYAINKATQTISTLISGAANIGIGNGVRADGIKFDGSALWVLLDSWGGGGVAKYSETGAFLLTADAAITGLPYQLEVGAGYVYVMTSEGFLYKLDGNGVIVASRIIAAPLAFSCLFWDGVNLWFSAGNLYKVDANLATIIMTTGISVQGIASDGVYLWVTNQAANSISKIDKITGLVLASYDGYSSPTYMSMMPNGLLVVTCDTYIAYADPATGAMVAATSISDPQQVIADTLTNTLYIPNDVGYNVIILADLLATGILDYIVGTTRIERSDINISSGLSVDECKVTLHCYQDSVIGLLSMPNFALIGGFDNAHIKIELAVMPTYNDTTAGAIHLFEGLVSDVVMDLSLVELTVSSDSVRLNVQIPRLIYQPTCSHTLFDSHCGLSKAAFTVSRTVIDSISTGEISFADATTLGIYALGRIIFTSGANAGLSRTVKVHSGSLGVAVILPLYPFPFIATAGDTFTISQGCDKSRALCTSRFNNASQFLGFEYMPVPEVSA